MVKRKYREGLWKHQLSALLKFKDKDFAGLFFDMGAGKTRTSLAIIEDNAEDDDVCIIICPKNLQTQWMKELKGEDAFMYISLKLKTKKYTKALEDFINGCKTQ